MTPLLLLLLLLLWSHAALAAADKKKLLDALAHALYSEDLFESRINSELVDRNISHCHNIYRRYCPRDIPGSEGMFRKLKNLIRAADYFDEFSSLNPKNIAIERLRMAATLDHSPYDTENRVKILAKIDDDTLIRYFGTPENEETLRRNLRAGESKRDRCLEWIAAQIERTGYVLETDGHEITVTEAVELIRFELMILKLAQRDSINHEQARARVANILDRIIEEYETRIKKAPWSLDEDRFGNAHSYVILAYIRNISYGIAFANQYSIPDAEKASVLRVFEEEFFKRYNNLSGLAQMGMYRWTRSYREALEFALRQIGNGAFFRKLVYGDKYEAGFAYSPIVNGTVQHTTVINHYHVLHTALTARTASLIAFTGFAMAHELYHHIQVAYASNIEDMSIFLNGQTCVREHVNIVCDRFFETSCRSADVTSEDSADVYGVQIAYSVFEKMMGKEADKIILPKSGTTNRQLFFQSIAIGWCYADANWSGGDDTHNGELYRVIAILGQLPDFRRTFGCYDDDLMVFPESSMCPAFSSKFA